MPKKLEKFAWPGGYTILYVFTQDKEYLVLCWECATKAMKGIEECDERYEHYKEEGSYINWEGESSWCDDCGVELESEYGIPDSGESEPQVEMLPPYPLHESEVDVLQYEREVTEYK